MRIILSIFSLLSAIILNGQVLFKTVVPPQPIVAGESFQVQYTIQDGEDVTGIKPPSFSPFRLVSGPNTYHGSVSTINGVKPLRNIVYTLVAERPGKYIIYGASAMHEGELIRSNDAIVEVISKEEALKRVNKQDDPINSEYILRPGENAYEKIRKNLFMKVMVDKTSCYVGEPILATFKLYSRLESRSDIVKNPGFYGFTVFDMLNLSDKHSSREQVDGKIFDVHTIRKVQLYPLQSGDFIIDAMEVKNKVEFSRSAVNKKTEQEIVEGVLNTDEDTPDENATIVESNMNTEPVKVHVKELPAKNKPAEFNGAMGDFNINARVVRSTIARNEEGMLEITITGQGNFIQLAAPDVKWPKGLEGFDHSVKDALDRNSSPLSGHRRFLYGFVASSPGNYKLPSIQFSFFNPDSGRYVTRTTNEILVEVSATNKKENTVAPATVEKLQKVNWLLIAIIAAALAGILLWLVRKNRTVKKAKTEIVTETKVPVASFLSNAMAEQGKSDIAFYTALQKGIWDFFHSRLVFSGSQVNKSNLISRMDALGIGKDLQTKVYSLLEFCESGMFTNADLSADKQKLLDQTRILLEKIDEVLL